MNKHSVIAIVVIFVVWTLMDMLVHGMLLRETYEATASLWRSDEEMKWTLMHVVTLIYATTYVCIYSCFIGDKSIAQGAKYGVVFGVAMGVPMGFGSYSYMPIPMSLAVSWFISTLVASIIAGLIVGALVKQKEC